MNSYTGRHPRGRVRAEQRARVSHGDSLPAWALESFCTEEAHLTEPQRTTGNEAALQRKVDDTAASGNVRLPPGTWTLTNSVDLSGYDGLTIQAPRGAVLEADGASPPSHLLEGSATDNISISGVTFDLNGTGTTGLYGFKFRKWDIEGNAVVEGTASGTAGIDFDGDGTRVNRHGSAVARNVILGSDIGIRFKSKTPQYSAIFGNLISASGTTGIKSLDVSKRFGSTGSNECESVTGLRATFTYS